MLEKESLEILREAVEKLEAGFADLPDFAERVDMERLRSVLLQTAEKMQNNYPYHHPFYIGQMLKPPHPVARLAYMLSMWINPNNHALDGSRASSPMEKEAVYFIRKAGPHMPAYNFVIYLKPGDNKLVDIYPSKMGLDFDSCNVQNPKPFDPHRIR